MYCPRCGREIDASYAYCDRCGVLNRVAPEVYASGVSSPSIRRKPFFPSQGIYATSRRIFIVRAPLKIQLMGYLPFLAALVTIIPISVITVFYFPNINEIAQFYLLPWIGQLFVFVGIFAQWLRDTSPVSIEQLEHRGAIQISREEIWSIELQDGGFWSPSKIVICSRSGRKTSLQFAENGAFKQIAPILRSVDPDRCYTHA